MRSRSANINRAFEVPQCAFIVKFMTLFLLGCLVSGCGGAVKSNVAPSVTVGGAPLKGAHALFIWVDGTFPESGYGDVREIREVMSNEFGKINIGQNRSVNSIFGSPAYLFVVVVKNGYLPYRVVTSGGSLPTDIRMEAVGDLGEYADKMSGVAYQFMSVNAFRDICWRQEAPGFYGEIKLMGQSKNIANDESYKNVVKLMSGAKCEFQDK